MSPSAAAAAAAATLPPNQAALLPSKQSPLTISPVPTPSPGPREILIRVRAVTINPVDSAIVRYGIIHTTFPQILGSDLSGTILSVGSSVPASFSPGMRVVACVESGAHQLYACADYALVAKLPEKVAFAEGAVIPLVLTTAASGIFEKAPRGMGVRYFPRTGDVEANGEIVIVWGGASGVGSCAVQVLKAAGYEVGATASAKNEEYVKNLGADWVWDYKKEGGKVVEEIIEVVKKSGKKSAGVFSAIMDNGVIADCIRIVEAVGGEKVVGTVAPTVMPFDVEVPEGVRLGWCNSTADILPNSWIKRDLKWEGIEGESMVPGAVWESWLGEALENGTMRCMPKAKVVGKGLEMIQVGLEVFEKGVSAEKIVIEL